jgi:hypothetical protein
VGGTAWCRRQCAVPSWGRRVARASAGGDGSEGVGFFYERGEAVHAAEKSRPALCATTPIYGEVGAAIFARWVISRSMCGYSMAYKE